MRDEKQALLEAQNLDERIEILLSLMKMSVNENKNIVSGAVPFLNMSKFDLKKFLFLFVQKQERNFMIKNY